MPKPFGASGDKPRVLILCPEAPWPMHGGGAIRSASLVHYFAARARVDLIVFREAGSPREPVPQSLVRRVSYIDLPPHRRDPLSRAARNARRWVLRRPPLLDRFAGFDRAIADSISGEHYDLALVEHFWCAPYVEVLRSSCDEVWLDLHNLESEWHETLSRRSSVLTRAPLRTFAAACHQLESALLPRFDLVLVPSDHEAAAAQKLTTPLHTFVYPNALQFIASPVRHEEETIAFSGNLEYQPNIDAVRFFMRRIWPLLRQRHAGLRWKIIGRNPRAVARLVRGDDRIELTGPVENAVSELARARVAVAPVLAGSGTRLKILEAWAAGTPMVSTSFGARGIPATSGGDIVIADQPLAFAAAVSELLSSAERRLSLSAAGRRIYERSFTWESAWRLLECHPSQAMSRQQSLYTG